MSNQNGKLGRFVACKMDLSISDLISSLKSAFRPSEFKQVEMILSSREEQMRSEKEALEEKIRVLQNDYKSVCENEKKTQERFTSVSDMLTEVSREKVVFEGEKRKLEKENEILKNIFLVWEVRIGQLEEEASKLTRAESELSAKLKGKKDGAANASAVAVDSTSRSIVEQSGDLHLKSNGNLANKEQGTGPSCTNSLSKLFDNIKEKKFSASKHGSGVETAAPEPEGASKLVVTKPAYDNAIEISDSEDETEPVPDHASNLRGNDSRVAAESREEQNSQTFLARKFSSLNGDENGISLVACPSASRHDRKRARIMVPSESDDEDEDNSKFSNSQCAAIVSGSEHGESTTPTKMSMSCIENASGAERIPLNNSSGPKGATSTVDKVRWLLQKMKS